MTLKLPWIPLWGRCGGRCSTAEVHLLLPHCCSLSPRSKLVRKLCTAAMAYRYQKDSRKTWCRDPLNVHMPWRICADLIGGKKEKNIKVKERVWMPTKTLKITMRKLLGLKLLRFQRFSKVKSRQGSTSHSLICTVLQRLLNRLLPSVLNGWNHYCRYLYQLFQ